MSHHDQARVPPYSDELEQSVLGSILMDNRAWDRIGDTLAEADFYSLRHRAIFAAAIALLAAGVPADVITVFERLRSTGDADAAGGLTYLNALAQSVPSAAHATRYAAVVRRLAVRRALIAAMREAVSIACEQEDVDLALDAITTSLGDLQRRQLRSTGPRPISEIALERIDHYTALQDGSVAPGWPTHISGLDLRLNGGLRPGSLYILAARPSVGKSSFAQSIGLSVAGDGLPTLFCSMEMASSEVTDRGVANSGRASYSALLTGKMSDDDWSRTVDAAEHLARLPFFVDDQPALTLRDVRFKAKAVKGLKVLIVDYLQLMAGSRRDGNRNGEIEEISRGLKSLAKELGVAIIALSQLNRAVETRQVKRPALSDLRDSGAIEQDADVVMFLWPVRDLESEGRRILGLGIDKNRQGRLGDVALDFHGDTQRWRQSDADIRPAPMTRSSRDEL